MTLMYQNEIQAIDVKLPFIATLAAGINYSTATKNQHSYTIHNQEDTSIAMHYYLPSLCVSTDNEIECYNECAFVRLQPHKITTIHTSDPIILLNFHLLQHNESEPLRIPTSLYDTNVITGSPTKKALKNHRDFTVSQGACKYGHKCANELQAPRSCSSNIKQFIKENENLDECKYLPNKQTLIVGRYFPTKSSSQKSSQEL
jgi:hypothetical protein